MNEKSVFETLREINVNDHTDDKNGLTYLSWAWAVDEVTKQYPGMKYDIWRDGQGKPFLYIPELGYMVFTTVTIEGETKMMWLPVMDGANKAMKSEPYHYLVKNKNFKWAKLNPNDGRYYDKYGNEQPEYLDKVCEAATMFDINTAIMRCLVKNFAMFGLGLYIYAGEDLPEQQETPEEQRERAEQAAKQREVYIKTINKLLEETCTNSLKMIEFVNKKFETSYQAFAECRTDQLIYVIQKLTQKKEKLAKTVSEDKAAAMAEDVQNSYANE